MKARVNTNRIFGNVLLYLAAILLVIFILGPLLWVLSASFQLETALFKRPPEWIPENPTIANYRYVFTGEVPQAYEERGLLRSPITQEALFLPQSIGNSFLVAIGVTSANLVLGTLAAYTFAREQFKGHGASYLFILGSRLLPAVVVAVPVYQVVQFLDMLDTKRSLLLLHGAFTLPFTIWVLTLYFQKMPRELEEAALIDGCTRFGALRRVVIPIAAPGLAAVGAFSFLFSYSEFVFALFTTQTMNAKTVPVLTSAIANNPDASYTLIAVGVMLSILPPLALAFIFQRFITSGLVASFGRS
jgi:multiple sugar transport system permease protein